MLAFDVDVLLRWYFNLKVVVRRLSGESFDKLFLELSNQITFSLSPFLRHLLLPETN